MMGALAAQALASGGRVTGVLPRVLSGREIAADSITELLIVDSLAERKAALFERADAFVVLPGGVGTLDELADVLVRAHLGLSIKPVAIVNVGQFYRPLAALIDAMADAGFVDSATIGRLAFHEAAADALDWLESMVRSADLDFSIVVPATMAEAWRILTDPAYIPRWLFGVTPDAPPVAGSGYTYRSANRTPALTGTFHAVEAPSLLEMSFSAVHSGLLAAEPESLLRWRLLPRGNDTAVELRHSHLARSPATAARAAKDWPIAMRAFYDLSHSLRNEPLAVAISKD